MENLKIKPLTKEQLLISLDRLTRFKEPERRYLRVFTDIITGNLIEPKIKKNDLEKFDYTELKSLAENIINYSIEITLGKTTNDYSINKKLADYEKSIYIFDKNVEKLINNKINYKACLNLIDENSPQNLQWLKALDCELDIKDARYRKSLKFPLEKIVIAEGATEETLLPEFGKKCGYDFDRHGVFVVSAGGKNQVVKAYYEMSENIKLPIFVLLDCDAKENLEQIKPKLRSHDKIHLVKCGEFEDLLPITLVERTLEYELKNISTLEVGLIKSDMPRVEALEEVFKTRGRHEFKKAEFAKMVKENIKTETDISIEIKQIIQEIKNT